MTLISDKFELPVFALRFRVESFDLEMSRLKLDWTLKPRRQIKLLIELTDNLNLLFPQGKFVLDEEKRANHGQAWHVI